MTEDQIAGLLQPYILAQFSVPPDLYGNLADYLELLTKWNLKTNLTAIRDPAEMVQRHFGESLFAAQHIGPCKTLLDFGSGAGFPGLPIQLFRSDIAVTVSESQNKKAAFLREVVRTLQLKTEVWAARVEAMPPGRQFDVVTLRAVDKMQIAIAAAMSRARHKVLVLSTDCEAVPEGMTIETQVAVPGSRFQKVYILTRKG